MPQYNKDKERLEEYLRQAKEYKALNQSLADTQIKQSENKDEISNLEAQIEIETNKISRLQDEITSLDTKDIEKNIKKMEKAKKKINKSIEKHQYLSQTTTEFDELEIEVTGELIFYGAILGLLLFFVLGIIITSTTITLPPLPTIIEQLLMPIFGIVGGVVGGVLIPLKKLADKFRLKFLHTEKRIKLKQAKFKRKSTELQKTLSSHSSTLTVKQNISKEINQAVSVIKKLEKTILSRQERDKHYIDEILDIQTKMNDAYVNLILIEVELKSQGLDVPSVFDEEPKTLEEPTIETEETFDIERIEAKEIPKVKKKGKLEGPKKPTLGIDSKNINLFL